MSSMLCSNPTSIDDEHINQLPKKTSVQLSLNADELTTSLSATAADGTKEQGSLPVRIHGLHKTYIFADLCDFLTWHEIEFLRIFTGLRSIFEEKKYYSNLAQNLHFTLSQKIVDNIIQQKQSFEKLRSLTLSGDKNLCLKALLYLYAPNSTEIAIDVDVLKSLLNKNLNNFPNLEKIILKKCKIISFTNFAFESSLWELPNFEDLYFQAEGSGELQPLNIHRFMLTKEERIGKEPHQIYTEGNIEDDDYTTIFYEPSNQTHHKKYKKVIKVSFHLKYGNAFTLDEAIAENIIKFDNTTGHPMIVDDLTLLIDRSTNLDILNGAELKEHCALTFKILNRKTGRECSKIKTTFGAFILPPISIPQSPEDYL